MYCVSVPVVAQFDVSGRQYDSISFVAPRFDDGGMDAVEGDRELEIGDWRLEMGDW